MLEMLRVLTFIDGFLHNDEESSAVEYITPRPALAKDTASNKIGEISELSDELSGPSPGAPRLSRSLRIAKCLNVLDFYYNKRIKPPKGFWDPQLSVC